MVGEKRNSNGGDVFECVSLELSSANGFHFGSGSGSGSASGSGSMNLNGELRSEGLRTYKRRKREKSRTENGWLEDQRVDLDAAKQLADQIVKEPQGIGLHKNFHDRVGRPWIASHAMPNGSNDMVHNNWTNFVLEHLHQSLSEDGGITGCIREALIHNQETCCTAPQKETVNFHEDRQKNPLQTGKIVNGSRNAAKRHANVSSNGYTNESNHQSISEMCQKTLFNVITSEKFASLCNLLFENFQQVKIDSFFDFSFINSRMKEGMYESSPMCFYSDLQQVWTKLQKIGTEIVSLTQGLSAMSRASCGEQVGGSLCTNSEREKNEEPYWRTKPAEQIDTRGPCACRHCGGRADGRDCLVCDSCEEMYHVSCVEPPIQEIPLKSWYCANCFENQIESPHENCLVCERLNAPRNTNLFNPGLDIIPENDEYALQVSSKEIEKLGPCKMCLGEVDCSEKFRVCEHPFCDNKFYHQRCLSAKEINSYGPRWYCPSCLCRACLTDHNDDRIILCDSCDHAYHIYCLRPPRNSIPRGKWFCRECKAGIRDIHKAKNAYEMIVNERKSEGQELLDLDKNEGAVDMLLTAANRLHYEEKLAAIHQLRS